MKAIRNVIIFGVLVAVLVFSIRACMRKNPITAEKFISHMSSNNFIVVDKLASAQEGSVKQDDNDRGVTTNIEATSVTNQATVVFKIYETVTQAEDRYNYLVNSKKFMVSNKDPLTYNFTNDENFVTQNNGINYSRYYTRDINNNYTIFSRIENTIIEAKIDMDDKSYSESIISKLNY